MKNGNALKWQILAATVVLAAAAWLVSTPTASSAAVAADAASIYTAKCAKCHGADGKGVEKFKKQGVKDFTAEAWQKANTDAKIIAAINNGKGDFMPGWKDQLKPAEVKSLVAYLRAFGKKK